MRKSDLIKVTAKLEAIVACTRVEKLVVSSVISNLCLSFDVPNLPVGEVRKKVVVQLLTDLLDEYYETI